MGLNERIHGTNVAKYAIQTEGNDNLFTFNEIEVKIQNRELQRETLVFCNDVDSDPRIGIQRKWKPAVQYHELRTVFEKLPPTPPNV